MALSDAVTVTLSDLAKYSMTRSTRGLSATASCFCGRTYRTGISTSLSSVSDLSGVVQGGGIGTVVGAENAGPDTDGQNNRIEQELIYRKQIARQLRTQYVEGIYRPR